jgi:putative ABC transport system permease protein
MLKNYIKIAWRNLTKHKIYSAITMSGLVLGLGVFIVFALLLYSQSKFDTFHDNKDRIYTIVQVLPRGVEKDHHAAITPAPLKDTLLAEFPEIEGAARFFPPGRMIVRYGETLIFYPFLHLISLGERPRLFCQIPIPLFLLRNQRLNISGMKIPLAKT